MTMSTTQASQIPTNAQMLRALWDLTSSISHRGISMGAMAQMQAARQMAIDAFPQSTQRQVIEVARENAARLKLPAAESYQEAIQQFGTQLLVEVRGRVGDDDFFGLGNTAAVSR